MYSAFDPFLLVGTWHTNHDLDNERFDQALNTVVDDPAFDPNVMGDYMRQQKNVVNGQPAAFEDRIEQLVARAWAVKEFLETTGR